MIQLARFGCPLNRTHPLLQKSGCIYNSRMVHMKQCTITPLPENHDERNMLLKRPLSPHLLIYAPQITSMLSITQRFTGMALAGYAVLFGFGSVVLPDTIPHYLDALASQHVGSLMINSGKFMLAFPMSYHFWIGIRYVLWYSGKFLTNAEVATTGYVMLALTFASAIGICLL